MRIGLASDVHGRWNTLMSWARAQQVEVIIVAGDLGVENRFPLPTYFAFGNCDDRYDYQERQRAGYLVNCHGVDDYGFVEIGGLKWMFLGCEYLPRIGPGLVPEPEGDLPNVDVLVTHEAPIRTGPFPPHPVVEEVVRRVQPTWCFSGHRHLPAHGFVGATECISLSDSPDGWAILHTESRSVIRTNLLSGDIW